MTSRAEIRQEIVASSDGDLVVVVLRGGRPIADWRVDVPLPPTLLLVDHLARVQLAARRLGCAIELYGSPPALCELLDFVGLLDVVACRDAGDVSPNRSPLSALSADNPRRFVGPARPG